MKKILLDTNCMGSKLSKGSQSSVETAKLRSQIKELKMKINGIEKALSKLKVQIELDKQAQFKQQFKM
ncbi:hypothetical protein EBS40_04000 [bacterium]|nr:hypothetical protein [bacterium]